MRTDELNQIAKLGRHLAAISKVADAPALSRAVVDLLRDFVTIDEISIISYPPLELPIIDYRDTHTPMTQQNLDTFIQGAFVLDPYYVAAMHQNRYGFFTLDELAPKGFLECEYYRMYYQFAGLEDECGFLFSRPLGGFTNVSLARTKKGKQFSSAEIKLLGDLTGSLCCAFAIHTYGDRNGDASTGLRLEVDSAIASFGALTLTHREQEIVSMILHGYAGKVIAAALGISIETVKLHRKNAYAKLEVKSQVELFYAFISSLAKVQPPQGL